MAVCWSTEAVGVAPLVLVAPPPAVATPGFVPCPPQAARLRASSGTAAASHSRCRPLMAASTGRRASTGRNRGRLRPRYARAREHGGVRILVVEDEPLIADAVAEWLRREAMAVDVAYDGDAALERLGVNDYDVLVLDRDLPGVPGDEVCRAVVDSGAHTRILMLTAAAAVRDRVAGLRLGADDYLSKPFAFTELSARVHALLRRARPADPPTLCRAGIRLDPAARQVYRDNRYVPLSRKEFAVLTELLRSAGTVVSAEDLLERAWDENIDPFTNVVRVTLMKLRRKLGEPSVIETVPGVGYRIP